MAVTVATALSTDATDPSVCKFSLFFCFFVRSTSVFIIFSFATLYFCISIYLFIHLVVGKLGT